MINTNRAQRVVMAIVIGWAAGQAGAAGDATLLDKADRSCQQGFAALESGDLARAQKAFTKATGLVPAFPEAHRGLGMVAMAEKRFDDALSEFRSAEKGYSELGAQLFEIRLRAYNDARSSLPELRNKLAELAGVSASDSSMTSGDRRFLMSDLKDRIHVIESTPAPTEESSSEPPPILDFNIGNALSRLGRWQEAVASFEACVRKRPEFSYAYNNLALAYWRSGKVEEARAALAKAEELGFAVNPNFKADLMK